MTEIEKAFEEWKKRDDNTIEIDGKTYHRIIWSEVVNFSFLPREIVCAVLDPHMPSGREFQDENGNHFTFDSYCHFNFLGPTPEWYFEAGQVVLDWHETKEIGEYLTVCE